MRGPSVISRFGAATLAIGFAGVLLGCGTDVRADDDDSSDGGSSSSCTEGQTRCSGTTVEICTNGQFTAHTECPEQCDDALGCVVCIPDSGTCDGDTSHACLWDGSGYEDVYCDPVQGMSCSPSTGRCDGACAPRTLGKSYIGCEYYPTVTGNDVSNDFDFAIAVSNTSTTEVQVSIEEGGLTSPINFTVPPDSVALQRLPWQTALKLCNKSGANECGNPQTRAALAAKGAFRLRTTYPVTVYQFNSLDYQHPDNAQQFSYTNDASLLLPTNVWTGNYLVAAWPQLTDGLLIAYPGLLAVTAREDGTTVTVTTTTDTPAAGGAPAFATGAPGQVTLNRGDVLEIGAYGQPLSSTLADLTGSTVVADKPVQVISGHYCAYVPTNVAACDHLEESMFPVETLSTRYIVTAPAVPPLPNGKEQIVRIVATQPNTNLTFDPPQSGVDTTIANAGGFVEIARQVSDFAVTADHKILVVQYMEGQLAGGDTGDPAMTLAVATDQYRTSYLFHAPTNYEVNYVNITAPSGATITLDGSPVSGFTAIGSSGFGLARVTLDEGVDGNHTITGTEAFGISVYGYGQYTSYWYPGGLNLDVIPIE